MNTDKKETAHRAVATGVDTRATGGNAGVPALWCVLVMALGMAALCYAASPSTEVVQSRTDGLHIGGKTTDRVGAYNAAPVAQPHATAQASIVPTASATISPIVAATISPSAPAATASPTAVPTITPTTTPVGSDVNPSIAKLNELTTLVNSLIATQRALETQINAHNTAIVATQVKENQLVVDNLKNVTLGNQIRLDLVNLGWIKGAP